MSISIDYDFELKHPDWGVIRSACCLLGRYPNNIEAPFVRSQYIPGDHFDMMLRGCLYQEKDSEIIDLSDRISISCFASAITAKKYDLGVHSTWVILPKDLIEWASHEPDIAIPKELLTLLKNRKSPQKNRNSKVSEENTMKALGVLALLPSRLKNG